MNMIGAPKHVRKAIDAGTRHALPPLPVICPYKTEKSLCGAGVDIICAQGGEGGGHTGEIPTSVLIPKVRSPKLR